MPRARALRHMIEVVRDQSLGDEGVLLRKLAHQFKSGVLLALGLNRRIENLALGVDCTPQMCRPPIDLQKDFVKMPSRVRLGPHFAAGLNNRAEIIHPAAHGFDGRANPALG